MTLHRITLLLVAALLTAATANAETLFLQEGHDGIGSDGTVFFAGNYTGSLGTGMTRYNSYDYGGQSNMAVDENGYAPGNTGVSPVRSIVYFDLAQVASFIQANPNYQVTGATLKLYQQNTSGTSSPTSIEAYRIVDANAGWNVGVGNGTPAGGTPIAGAATAYLRAADGVGGGDGWTGGQLLGYTPGTGYDTTPLASAIVDPANVDNTLINFVIDTDGSLINDWMTDVNAGVIIRGAVGTDAYIAFWTPKRGVANLRPALEISYDVVPEPGSLALLGLGGLILLRRRRAAQH